MNEKRTNSLLRLVYLVIFDYGKGREEDLKPLGSLHEGEEMNFQLIFPNHQAYDILIPANKTVLELRHFLQKRFALLPGNLSITATGKLLRRNWDPLTFRSLKFCSSEKIELRPKTGLYFSDFLAGDSLKPEAIRCLRMIFNRFSEGEAIPYEKCLDLVSALTSTRRRH